MRLQRFHFVGFIIGMLLLALGGVMVVPLLVDLYAGSRDWAAFAVAAMITLGSGGALALSCYARGARLERRAGYLLTVLAWCAVGAFGSLPLILSKLRLSVTDAVFETVSGLTTTGATVLSGLDVMAPGLLLWRSLLQWIGGVGIVATAIVLLPVLGVGGMQLFRMESSDISGKPTHSAYQMAGTTVGVYVALSVACAIAYAEAGMPAFDAINHAMTTIATGGFSTHDASMAYFNSPAIEIVGIVFMMSGAFPLIWYAVLVTRPRGSLDQERQVPALVGILVVATALVTAWNVSANAMPFGRALRLSAFNVTSVLTDTGFATADYSTWGSFPVGVFFVLLFVGGCAGSTAGAIKVFRWQLLFAGLGRHLRMMLSPNSIIAVRYGGRTVEVEMLSSVRNFLFMYFITFMALSLMVMATGLDFLASTSAVATAMANSGAGLGPVVGPGTTFAATPDSAKWLLVGAMLLGRLELSTVYVLFLAGYWKWR